MDSVFISSLKEKARARRALIGIGIWNADAKLIDSLQSASEYADLLLVGECCTDCSLDCIPSKEPWKELVQLLAEGKIEGAVRGNLPAGRTMRSLAAKFDIKVKRLALLELSGWSFLLGPVGIDEGETILDRLGLVLDGAKFLRDLGISPKASILSGGRMEDLGRCDRIDRNLAEGELIVSRAREAGVNARHKGILIESCQGDDIIIAPDGVSGNLIFRTMMLLCKANSLGAPIMMEKVFVDSSRARYGFDGPIMLASSMVGMREKED